MTPIALGLTEALRQWKLILAGGAVIACLIFYILWQGASERAHTWKLKAEEQAAIVTQLKRRNDVLEREAVRKVADDAAIDAATTELKDKIDEAAKQVPPGAVTDPAARAVSCRRLQRSGQTTSAQYRNLCGG